jgi:hypothetical protein
MSDAYTIRIFVADGDPEGLRIIDQLNWTGLGAVFPRQRWPGLKADDSYNFDRPGIYLLWGFVEEDELPTLYIGQGDCVSDRIGHHFKQKDFWQYCVVFTSTSSNFNSAHAQWIEHALVRTARDADMCHLENGNSPLPPALAKSDMQDARKFFHEIVRILPLVGLRALEKTKPIVVQSAEPVAPVVGEPVFDTLVVPAKPDGFNEVFLGKDCWYYVRIAGAMLDKIKWIAAYVSQPTSAITHVAPVKQIEPYGQDGKFRVVFSGPARKIGPIPFGDAPKGTMQGPRYGSYAKLLLAKKLMEVF